MKVDISEAKTLDDFQRIIHEWGIEKGWTFEEKDVPEKLMLIVTEISEAMEEYRKGGPVTRVYFSGNEKPEGLMVELADAIIRILHIAERFGVDMTSLLRMKMQYNQTRPFRHGDKRA